MDTVNTVLDPAKLSDSIIERILEVGNLTSMLARDPSNPTTIFVNHLLSNAESAETLQSAALATLMAIAMAKDPAESVSRMSAALATFAYFGYQLAQAQMAELPASHS